VVRVAEQFCSEEGPENRKQEGLHWWRFNDSISAGQDAEPSPAPSRRSNRSNAGIILIQSTWVAKLLFYSSLQSKVILNVCRAERRQLAQHRTSAI
jgi:hypothetical protein